MSPLILLFSVPLTQEGNNYVLFFFFDRIRISRYLSILEKQTERKTNDQQPPQLASLKSKRFGNALSDTKQHVLNLSKYERSDLLRFVLSHGLNFDLPPKSVSKEQTFDEFESLRPSCNTMRKQTKVNAMY